MAAFRRCGSPHSRWARSRWRAADFIRRGGWASWPVKNGPRLQEWLELGSWSGCERVLRFAHPAIDHLRDTAGRIDGTFTPHRARPRLARVEQAIDSDGRDSLE